MARLINKLMKGRMTSLEKMASNDDDDGDEDEINFRERHANHITPLFNTYKKFD